MVIQTADTPLTTQRPRFLWWRFALVTAALSVAALGFCRAWYCEVPEPYQQVIFLSVLVLILIETVQAGWYRNDNPWEVRIAETTITVIFLVLFFAIFLALIIFVITVVPDLILAMVLITVLLLIMGLVWSAFVKEG